jgi:hypothetical protein
MWKMSNSWDEITHANTRERVNKQTTDAHLAQQGGRETRHERITQHVANSKMAQMMSQRFI